jgi:hypothetical protein
MDALMAFLARFCTLRAVANSVVSIVTSPSRVSKSFVRERYVAIFFKKEKEKPLLRTSPYGLQL